MKIRILSLCAVALMALASGTGIAAAADSTSATPMPSSSAAAVSASAPTTSSSAAPAMQAPAASSAAPEDAEETQVGTLFSQRFNTPVTTVRRTPFGFYEVQVGSQLIYTDKDIRWVFEGHLIDVAQRTDLTAQRIEAINQVPFASLPLDLAIKTVKGKGEHKIAVFEDPFCPYCHQLDRELDTMDNVTIYTFLLPILRPESKTVASNIWCARNPSETWQAWMQHGKTPPTASCDAPVDQWLALGNKLNVTGTPTMIFADGRREVGALATDQLEQALSGS